METDLTPLLRNPSFQGRVGLQELPQLQWKKREPLLGGHMQGPSLIGSDAVSCILTRSVAKLSIGTDITIAVFKGDSKKQKSYFIIRAGGYTPLLFAPERTVGAVMGLLL